MADKTPWNSSPELDAMLAGIPKDTEVPALEPPISDVKPVKRTPNSRLQSKYEFIMSVAPSDKKEEDWGSKSIRSKYDYIMGDEKPTKRGLEANFIEDIGAGASEAYGGMKQFAAESLAKLEEASGSKSKGFRETASRISKEEMEKKKFYKENNPDSWFGHTLGKIAAVPLAPSGYAGAAALGALSGATEVRPEEGYFTEAAKDAAIGTAVASVVKGIVDNVAGTLGKIKNTPKELDRMSADRLSQESKYATELEEYNKASTISEAQKRANEYQYKSEMKDYTDSVASQVSKHDEALKAHRSEVEGVKSKHEQEVDRYNKDILENERAMDSAQAEGAIKRRPTVEAPPETFNKSDTAKPIIDETLNKLKAKVGVVQSDSIDKVKALAAQGDEKAGRVLKEIVETDDADKIIKGSGNLEFFKRKAEIGKGYDELEGEIGNRMVGLNDTRKLIEKELNSAVNEKLPDNGLIRMLSYSLDSLSDLKTNTYSNIRKFRSNLFDRLSTTYSGESGMTGAAASPTISKIKESLEKDLLKFTDRMGPKIAQKARDLDTRYRTEVIPYRTTRIAKALKDAPEDEIMDTFIRQGKYGQAEKLYGLLEPRGREAVKYSIIKDASDYATLPSGEVSPAKMAEQLHRMKDPINAFFKGEDKWVIDGLKNLMVHLEGRLPTQVSKTSKPLVQPYIRPEPPSAPSFPKEPVMPLRVPEPEKPTYVPPVPKEPVKPPPMSDLTEELKNLTSVKILTSIPVIKHLVTSQVGRAYLIASSKLPPGGEAMKNATSRILSQLVMSRRK